MCSQMDDPDRADPRTGVADVVARMERGELSGRNAMLRLRALLATPWADSPYLDGPTEGVDWTSWNAAVTWMASRAQYDEAEERPASRYEENDWSSADLADALNRLTEERERARLQERIRIVGWVFVIGFVVLFLIVIRWMH